MFGDITSRRLLIAKGLLFLVIGALSAALIVVEAPEWKVAALLALCVWAFCRFYYFLFHVLEKYAGSARPYAGILDLVTALLKRRG